MYLKRLEIQGFKTFAPRTVFEFRPGITAIVGPNGSGKSNAADAVRWVLGEQSYTALRSRRSEDLIFGGGNKRAPAGFAEVSLTIDNSDRLLPLPYSEVTLARRVTRTGDNEYYINRNRVRLRDIQEAIGPLGGSYTIVNQGLVDAALNLRPEERRRLFEDAAEISIFEQRKQEAERRLRETAGNVQRCADVLAELEPRLRSLKRQAGLARTYRELHAELRVLLRRHYAELWQAARRALAAAEESERRLDSELAERRAAQAASSAELRVVRDELRALRERLGGLHAESGALHTRAEHTQRDLAVGGERLAALARRAEELERARLDLDLRGEELEHERALLADRLATAEQTLVEARTASAGLEIELVARENNRRIARRAIDTAQRAELEAATALADARRRLENLARRAERIAGEQQALLAEQTTAEQTLSARQSLVQQAAEQAAAAERAASEQANAAERARAELDTRRNARTRADEIAAQARRALTDAETQYETLTRLQRNYAGTFAGVKAAMQWAEIHKRAGFALVSSLIHTPAHVETAIEVALGSRLQYIVVEHWADAEDAIDALKRSGTGRATFLPLDTITDDMHRRGLPDHLRRAIAAIDPQAGIAAEMIDFDSHYATAIWSLLGRTLIVGDLPAARQILNILRNTPGSPASYVTLAGEQVSGGGAVTGGAQIKESGTLRRERELRELPEQIEAARHTLEQARHERATIDTQVGAAERELHEAEAARRRAIQEREARREQFEQARRASERAEADLSLHRRRMEQAAAEVAEMERQQATLAEELVALAVRETGARAHLEQIRAEEQTRTAEEQAERRQFEQVRATVASAEAEVRAQRAVLQSATQNITRLENQRAELDRRNAELVGERATLETRNETLALAHQVLLAEIDSLRAQITPAEAQLAAQERAQENLERGEAELTTSLLEGESAHGRAFLELQRSRDRLDALWERAAADDIDIDAEEPAPAETPDEETDLQTRIDALKTRIQRLGTVNPLALEEHQELSERYEFLSSQIDDLRNAEGSLTELISELDQAMRTRFETTFHAVAAEFERSFTRLFGGGQARLVLTGPGGNGTTPEDTGHAGVEIVARPPGKRQQTLALLSGGERALTAAALLFAILKVNPSPFCILDEVDAALDEANVGRFREALAELTEQTQFIVITHNRGTIESAGTIYGVSMGEDAASRILSLRLEEIA